MVPTTWEPHRELHLNLREPPKPDIGLTLHLIDRFDQYAPPKEEAVIRAVDWLGRQGSEAGLILQTHLIAQLGYLGIEHG